MDDSPPSRGPQEGASAAEPLTSVSVRKFLIANGVKEHNHASEIARVINVDRSQSYRRLKGDVAWSHTDLRSIATHFGAAEDHLLPNDDLVRVAIQSGDAAPALIRIAHMPPNGLLVAGAELLAGEVSDLVAVKGASGWEIFVNGEEPFGARRHAIEALTVRSHPHLQVALLEDDLRASEALVEAFRPLGIVATPYADSASLRAAIAHRRFDAYVLDWLLGEGTAARIVEEIRQHRSHIPIVVVTGALMADSEMERTLLELSAQWNFSTLDKPVRPMNLANTLKQLVAVARA
ncbi:MAG: helix-turn-helix domain-containing protein [Betaproteobacteria bacterium]